MPSGSEKRQRQHMMHIRCNDAEQSDVQERAGNAGLSTGAYIRMVVFNAKPPRGRRRPVKDGEALARILAQLGKIGSNVNQLAHAANNNLWPDAALWAEARQDIRSMRDLLMQALGVRARTDDRPR